MFVPPFFTGDIGLEQQISAAYMNKIFIFSFSVKVLHILSLVCTERFSWIFILRVKSLLLVFITAWSWAFLSIYKKTNCTLPRKLLPSFVDYVCNLQVCAIFLSLYLIKSRTVLFEEFAFETWSLGKQCDAITAVLAPKEFLCKTLRINKDGRENLEC